MRNAWTAATFVLSAIGIAACGHGGGQSTAASSQPSSEASASLAPATPESAGAATPEATATPNTNLLSWKNGTIVRAYPTTGDFDVNSLAERGISYPSGSTGPFVFDFELPGPAAITAFTADLPATEPSSPPASVTFAVSTNGAQGDYRDAGTLTATADAGVKTLSTSTTGRWIRVTSAGAPFNAIGATGTLQPLPAGVSPAGVYVELDPTPAKNGSFSSVPTDTDPWYRAVTILGGSMTAVRCFNGRQGDVYPGELDGRTWSFQDQSELGTAVVNDDASLIVGAQNGDPFYLFRSTEHPKWCYPMTSGSGPHHVLVLDESSPQSIWPVADNAIPGYSYERMNAGMLDAAALTDKEMALIVNICESANYMGKGQGNALLQWVGAGHKLLIYDSDTCSKSSYDFIPYGFITSNPGARGASSDRLIVVESDALGATDKNDAAHYFDPKTYVNGGSNQLGDANVVTTQDTHWCGHFFGTNANNDNGFEQMYATYGKGLIIYDGFDEDDGGNPGYQRARSLEFALPIPAAMPCTQSVALAFLIQPNQEAAFDAGTATTLHASMETLANLGWKGHVDVKTTGDFRATVTPNAFDMSGGTQPMQIAVAIPASAKPGAYTVNVIGTGSDGKTAQAAITITGSAPLKKEVLKKHQRIRIYGIHFDYDSARIQPRSEPVIADIAALMRANPTWKFEVSGHTDSDGGAAYNLGLSQRRAQSVVNDLVTRYGIARSRLVAKGYGLARPVATNSTAAGKALNRRVELERLE